MLEKKVLNTIREHGLLEKGDKVICAVSGGADSMCLLTVMKALADELELKVYAANLNHSLRGAEGDGDSQYVETVCEIKGIPFFGKKLDIAAIAKARGKSVEETGRDERYRFFAEAAASLGGAKIATGHNMGDNAETVLFRLARGSGSRGLCGIRYKRGNIIRPLLDASRSEIEEYLLENAVMWREDSTNAELVYTRNKIRHGIIPLLKEINPDAVEKIVGCAKSLSEDEEYLRGLAEGLLASARLDDGEEYSTSAIMAAPLPIAKRAAAILLENWGARDIDQQKINAFLDLCGKPSGKRMDVNSDVYALRSFYTVVRRSREEEREFSFSIRPGQKVKHLDWEVDISITDTPPPPEPDVAVFDAAQLFGIFTVRSRRDGDKIRLKEQGSKKIKDLFIENRIPQDRRGRVPIIAKGDEIVFVPPLRRSPRYAPNENTRNFLVIKYTVVTKEE